ncbi:tyrosine-protein kinase receptor Tie-2-like [Lytechinus variegatus]|uniref:tyrosine-protein kinase receptor Tie-2-like n=1 Tax=Lytechinus variegatus TaxID=7654 RepID=UPI001BB118EC|nr:tyrosine-protein kinase receptor Tie-2-like [Lytechinus variegatus]
MSATASCPVTTLALGYTSTENGPVFDCITPCEDATVTFGRNVITDNSSVHSATDTPLSFRHHGNGYYSASLNTSSHQSYGVVYCAVTSQDEQSSVVPTIFVRSDARFIPTNGRFTKTVNKGDVNVTIYFTEITPTEAVKIWRFHPSSDSSQSSLLITSPSNVSSTVYAIPGEVDVSHAGVYELHLDGERHLSRAGLMRLLVRACPAGRYNVSSGCVHTCSSCYNGGICHDLTGKCICAIGFRGDNCQIIAACNEKVHGSCGWIHHGFQFCTLDPYGCSCLPGYKGLDCSTECDQGEFGASCGQKCHCMSGECDPFSGICTRVSDECEQGWAGLNCQECQIGRYGPNCICKYHDYTTLKKKKTVKIQAFTLAYEKPNRGESSRFSCIIERTVNLISTAQPVFELYRKLGNHSFNQINITPDKNGANNRIQEARFLVDNVVRQEVFYCTLFDVSRYRTEDLLADDPFIPPEIPSPPIVSRSTNDSVYLVWHPWNATTDVGDPPLMGYRVFYRMTSSLSHDFQELVKTELPEPSATVAGLTPDTDYVFGVAAVRPGPGGQGTRLDVRGRTKCLSPSGIPMSFSISPSKLPGTILLTWQNPPSANANCRSGYTGVRIYWEAVRSASTHAGYTDAHIGASDGYSLTVLDVNTRYVLFASMMNRDGEGPRSQQLESLVAKKGEHSIFIKKILQILI